MYERGFIFPLTLFIMSLLTGMSFYLADVFLLEKRSIHQQEFLLQLESIIQVSTVDVIENLSRGEMNDGLLTYKYGEVSFSINENNGVENQVTVTLRAVLERGQRKTVVFLYHLNNQRMTEYWEVTRPNRE
ncbi:competence type IV pilus minor pilin ComGG [Halalkalibacterium ligniniphilum]|uniref:competence type IV pilus minor pilin ComGG n=1 Tax=Halalkalibacterium ligniniphilum TaxID=1134413 RepID=UPI0003472496|nr:competence type IV pilus minor pilin ComGG [Halalkalibacterium ligniniphilum]